MNPLIQYWYFHLPNFVLAAVMYTLVGQLALSFFAPADWQNYIWRAFVRITEPALRIVRRITPQIVPEPLLIIFAVLWLMVLRVILFVGLGALNLLPTVSSPGA
jgi:uncharacterized protein YggT (Ycf19 family)